MMPFDTWGSISFKKGTKEANITLCSIFLPPFFRGNKHMQNLIHHYGYKYGGKSDKKKRHAYVAEDHDHRYQPYENEKFQGKLYDHFLFKLSPFQRYILYDPSEETEIKNHHGAADGEAEEIFELPHYHCRQDRPEQKDNHVY